MNKNEMIAKAIAEMSNEQKAQIFPPITRKNFVVRANWLGRNQIITFTNNKGQVVTYNHDEALKIMSPKLSIMPCWIKRGYWSQSTNYPSVLRGTSAITEVVDAIIFTPTYTAEEIATETALVESLSAFCTDNSPV
jgi:hypothetical protein|tara:strand:- start:258 stop:665 length:408 start_codon:yes stop_codon:yes gene_type:complete